MVIKLQYSLHVELECLYTVLRV